MPGEHTRQIAASTAGSDAAATDRLIAEGVLFGGPIPPIRRPAPMMSIDPRTPVLVGYGQVNEHDGDPRSSPST